MKICDVWGVFQIKLGLKTESIEAIKKHFPSQDLLTLESNRK